MLTPKSGAHPRGWAPLTARNRKTRPSRRFPYCRPPYLGGPSSRAGISVKILIAVVLLTWEACRTERRERCRKIHSNLVHFSV